MIFSDIFPLFLVQNFKTKVLTAQKNLLLECLTALQSLSAHFQKQFSHKVLYNYCSKIFWSASVRHEKRRKKNGFPIVFPKIDLANVGGNFHISNLALKLGRAVHITTLKSPRGSYFVVCKVTR